MMGLVICMEITRVSEIQFLDGMESERDHLLSFSQLNWGSVCLVNLQETSRGNIHRITNR